jgi:hypothetical protein
MYVVRSAGEMVPEGRWSCVAGGIFDFYRKSNRRDLDLRRRARTGEAHQTWRDWLFLGVIGLVIAGLVVLPLVVVYWAFRAIWGGGGS